MMWNSSSSRSSATARVDSGMRPTNQKGPAGAGGRFAGGVQGGARAGQTGRTASSIPTPSAIRGLAAQGRGPAQGANLRTSRRIAPAAQDLDDCNPIVAFLADMDMLQYAEPLLENGFDDMETLAEIEDADLAELGMPRGHVLKFRRRLREFTGAAPAPAVAPRPQPQPQCQAQAAPAPSPALAPQAAIVPATKPPSPARTRYMQPTAQMASSVQASWEQVKALGTDYVGGVLYRALFEIAPEAKQLFPKEVRCRYQDWTVDEAKDVNDDLSNSPALGHLFGKVIMAVGMSIGGLQDTEALVPRLKQLGMRHISYKGVTEGHFPVLLKALVKCLREVLGEMFTPEVEFAWSMVYNFITAIMIQGLREAHDLEKKAKQLALQQGGPQPAEPAAPSQEITMGREICAGKVITGGNEPYLVVQHLQKAIFGDVYAAEGVKSGRRFAMKALDMDLVHGFNTLKKQQDHQFCEAPLGEVQFKDLMAGLDHVVQLEDHFSGEHHHFVVSELASGGDLLDALRLRPGGFAEAQARSLIRGAALGLASLHTRGLAMQDVSVENMLLFVLDDNSWQVQVCDPGQAVAFSCDPATGVEAPVPFRGFVGKDFRPPEIYTQTEYLASKVDAWCLGWSTFYMLVAQPLFHSCEESAMDPDWAMFQRGNVSQLFEEKGWSSSLSVEAQDFILGLMQLQPEERMSIQDALMHPWLAMDMVSPGPRQERVRPAVSEVGSPAEDALHLPLQGALPQVQQSAGAPTLLQGGPGFVRSRFVKG